MSWLVRPNQVSRWTRVLRAARHSANFRTKLPCPPPAILTNLAQVLSRNYASVPRIKENIEPLLQRLDEDVRRVGRINRKDLNEVLEEFRVQNNVTSSQSLLVIRCCGSLVPEEIPEVRTKLVNEVWETLLKRNIPVDISHYNALLRVYIENEHKLSITDLLTEIESKGLQPNRVTYQRLMWLYCQQGDIEGASEILEKMREKNFPLTEAVLNALVLGHVRQNNLEGARSVLTAMGGAGIVPTSRTYSILIGGSARTGDIDTVKQMIKQCESNEIYFADRELMEVLEEFAVGGHKEHVEFLLNSMQKSMGYNQDAINLILRLVNQKCEDVALMVVKTLSKSFSTKIDSTPMYQSAFYIRHLVKTKTPNDIIVAHCEELASNGYSPKAFHIAVYESLLAGNAELAYANFDKILISGEAIRQHFFWPLFLNKGRTAGSNGVKEVLQKMILTYKIYPTVETLREYVIPYVEMTDSKKIVEFLRECNISTVSSVRSVLLEILSQNKMKEAAELAAKYGTRKQLPFFINSLVNSFKHIQDVDSLVKIVTLACSYSGETKNQAEESNEGDVDKDNRAAVGKLLNLIVKTNMNKIEEFLPNLLEKLHMNGIGTTSTWAAKIQESLGEKINNNLSNLLVKLTSDELTPVEFDIERIPRVQRTPQQLEAYIATFEDKGENPLMLKKQLIQQYARAKDVVGLESCVSKLESEKFHFTSGVMCQIMDMYCQVNNLQKAMDIYKSIIEKEPDFIIDNMKVVRLATQLTKNDRFEEAMEILRGLPINSVEEKEQVFQYNSLSWQFLNDLAEAGEVEKLNQVFAILLEKKVFEPTNVMLGPLVKVHLIKGNTKDAIEVFEDCCNRYRCTPWKNELNKKLIMEEDATGLQKLTDLSTVIHGEINSLYDLVFGFVECGRLKQARKILETPGMRMRNQRMTIACERYNSEGKVECLEGLLEATRELSHIDRSDLFQQLLKGYIRAGDVEKGLGLWTVLQEENVPPTDQFLFSLGEFLKSKNIEVPFVIPKEPIAEKGVSPIKNVQKEPSNDLAVLLDKNEYEEAGEYLIKLLKKSVTPKNAELKHVLSKLAQKGNCDMLEKIGSNLSLQMKKMTAFENKRCIAMINSGKTKEYLIELQNDIDSATDDNLPIVLNEFPIAAILKLLNNDNYDQVLSIAQKHAAHGSVVPFISLWSYHVIQNNLDEANKIWNEHLIDEKRLFFWSILREAEETKNPKLVDTLMSFIERSIHKTESMLGLVNGTKIEILLMNNNVNNAVETFENCLKNGIQINHFSKELLLKLKQAVTVAGGKFDYNISINSKAKTN